MAMRICREPGVTLSGAVLAPVSSETLEGMVGRLAGGEALLENPNGHLGGAVLPKTIGWSALVTWGTAMSVDELATALSHELAVNVYELGLEGFDDPSAGTAFLDEHRGDTVVRLWGEGTSAHDDPFTFARARLGRPLPPYRAGALADTPSPDLRALPWTALGVKGPAPTSFAVRVAGTETFDAITGGRLLAVQDVAFDGERGARGGLFDEAVFGPLRRDRGGRLTLESWADEDPRDRPQAIRFGRLVLPRAVLHPWAVRTSAGSMARTLYALATYDHVVVDGELVPTEIALAAGNPLQFGGDAVEELVRRGALPPEAACAALRELPVLPAGLRPIIETGDVALSHDASTLYPLVQRQIARVTRLLELDVTGALSILVIGQMKLLQRAVDALFVDGAIDVGDPEAGQWQPCSPDATPRVHSLRHLLALEARWSSAFDEVIGGAPNRPFSKRWHGSAYTARALLEASALEVVPVEDTGAVDDVAYRTSLLDRRLRVFSDVYGERLCKGGYRLPDDTPGDGLAPPVDVHVSSPRDGVRWILTAGMSARLMPDDLLKRLAGELLPVELAMQVPSALELDVVDQLALGLRALARYPFCNQTMFSDLHSVRVGRPLLPGSALTSFVFIAVDADVLESMRPGLPRSPDFLLALGITDDELAWLNGSDKHDGDPHGGPDQAADPSVVRRRRQVDELTDRTQLCTDPFRTAHR